MENSFGISIIPGNEQARLLSLQSYNILDTEPEKDFNNLALLVARCFKAPIALISLVDKERVFFKANVGMPGNQNVSRGISLCSLAILENDLTIFEDALKEPCLLANPLVAGDFGLRFYAGAPITTPDGFNIGTVCIVDKNPRSFCDNDKDLLSRFADVAMNAIEKRRQSIESTS